MESRAEQMNAKSMALIAVAAAILGAGCGSVSDDRSFDFDDVALFSGLDTRAVVSEQEEAIARCMAAEGFEYLPFVPRDSETYPDPGTLASLPDPDYVSVHGFGFSDRVRYQWESQDANPNTVVVEGLTTSERDAYFAALLGSTSPDRPTGGCVGDSISVEYLDAVRAVSELRFDAVLRMESDAEYSAIMKLWSVCMAEAGYDFADRRGSIIDSFNPRTDAVTQSRDSVALEELEADELRVATADLACVTPHATAISEIAARFERSLISDAESHLVYLSELTEVHGTR